MNHHAWVKSMNPVLLKLKLSSRWNVDKANIYLNITKQLSTQQMEQRDETFLDILEDEAR